MRTNFQRKVYRIVRKIQKGKTLSYKEIARKLKTSPRAIGQALASNKNQKVPCHGVIMSSGKLGGYNKGIKKKIKLLRKEGLKIKKGKIILG